jgi:hypothetical protein
MVYPKLRIALDYSRRTGTEAYLQIASRPIDIDLRLQIVNNLSMKRQKRQVCYMHCSTAQIMTTDPLKLASQGQCGELYFER